MKGELVGQIKGVCVGRVGEIKTGRRSIKTAFVKEPIGDAVPLTTLGFDGDEHTYEDHGGPDMAVLLYPIEHYTYWAELGIDLPELGAFAENLTVSGLAETDVNIGDVFQVTSPRLDPESNPVRLQVCQPRSPCYKIAARYGRKDLPALVQETGFIGYLARVLSEGDVAAGDSLQLVERTSSISVTEAGRIANVDRNDYDGARRILDIETLGSSTRVTLEARLKEKAALGLHTARLVLPD